MAGRPKKKMVTKEETKDVPTKEEEKEVEAVQEEVVESAVDEVDNSPDLSVVVNLLRDLKRKSNSVSERQKIQEALDELGKL